jgi:hypothetical protein
MTPPKRGRSKKEKIRRSLPCTESARPQGALSTCRAELHGANHGREHPGHRAATIVGAWLSFLGLGTQPPTPSWGWDLKANVPWILENAWLAVGPGCAIFITVLGFNLFGDGLRNALDPRLKWSSDLHTVTFVSGGEG